MGEEVKTVEVSCAILLVFPDGPHTTNCIFQPTNVDLGQMQIAADLLRRETDSSFEQIHKMMQDPNRRKGLFVPGRQ